VNNLTNGDENLNGTPLDTNSRFIAKNCVTNGLEIIRALSVADNYKGIQEGMDICANEATIIFITGGLGPTKDDITKEAMARYFGVELSFREEIFSRIEAYFAKRGKKQVELNKKLAYLPANAEILVNERGTAQGMWMEHQDKVFISMPGVPHEMQHLLMDRALPKIKEKFQLATIHNQYIMCAGIGESAIYEKIEDIENALPQDIRLAYLPSLGTVKLRLTHIQNRGEASKEKEIIEFRDKIVERIAKYVYSYDEHKSLAQSIGELLIERKENLATAESCTGGYISHLLTSIPGSSAYFEGALIAYSYDIKELELGVQQATLMKEGAVSEACVIEMTKGLLSKMKTNYGISVSGIAGPGGGTPDKPVGTVWIAVGNKDKIVAKKFELTKQRDYNIKISAHTALNLLRNFILEQ
ncbi:MAG: CinA family nicotinamide mononucleotide deamidase-related protein, partial [Bacteroidetes bacterium]|nr:CinA family nicotinamide mononucleotide deamidase-related protein [Bacteroidota bacterium]